MIKKPAYCFYGIFVLHTQHNTTQTPMDCLVFFMPCAVEIVRIGLSVGGMQCKAQSAPSGLSTQAICNVAVRPPLAIQPGNFHRSRHNMAPVFGRRPSCSRLPHPSIFVLSALRRVRNHDPPRFPMHMTSVVAPHEFPQYPQSVTQHGLALGSSNSAAFLLLHSLIIRKYYE